MASVRSTIELLITASTRGLGAASTEARAMASRIREAEDRVSAARLAQANANSRVAEAESRLNEARARGIAATAAVGASEDRVNRARATSQASAARLGDAENRLESLRAGGGSAATIARAEQQIQQARQRAEADTARLGQAEQALARARQSQTASGSRIQALEERLAQARNNQFRASENLAQAEGRLATVRRRGNDDINRQRDGILGVFDAFSRLAGAFSGADGASTSFLSKMAALNSVFSSIGGPIVQTVVGILEIVAALGAAGEIIGVVGGLIGQVLGGAPAILLALGAAALTVQLGMDGIKQAAQAAAPAFEKLKASVSGVFARELTPFFQRIGQVLPQLTAGFESVAVSVSQVAKEIIATTTSARGLTVLNGILSGTATLFRSLAPGVAIFVKGLLDAANIGQSAFNALGTAIGSVFQKIGEVFSRLAADGTIGGAVRGLAATISGLGAVVAPLIELFIRMGAALGESVGTALQGVGSAITQVTPFFVKLAEVAGRVLVDAFNQLGPPLRELVDSILPGAGAGLDGFAAVMHNVVLPAIAGVINFIRTNWLPGFILFSQSVIINTTAAASAILGFVSGALSALSSLFLVLGVATNNPALIKVAGDIETAKLKVDGLKTSIDGLHDKTVVAAATTAGQPQVVDMKNQIALINSKKVDVTATPVGTPGVVDMRNQIALTNSKKVDVTATVPDTPKIVDMHNQIALTNSKKVDVTASVPDTPKVVDMKNQIALTNSKKVDVTATVTGTSAVQALQSAIAAVKSKTVSIIANVTRILGLASGGPAQSGQTYLVGEKGPELLTLGRTNGFVTPAHKTRQLLSGAGKGAHKSTDGVGTPRAFATVAGDQPIHVTVNLSQEQIAGIAQVEIARRDRATKRVVLAGSGVTF